MKKRFSLVLAAVLMSMILAGCSPYVSSYKTIAMVQSNVSDSAFMDYSTLEGTMVFTLKAKENGAKLKYSGSIQNGDVTVYYDDDGTKKELFSLKGGDYVRDSLDLAQTGKVYVIVETNGKSEDGDFHFDIEE